MKSDKETAHSYMELYKPLLDPYRNTTGNILELGVLEGASIEIWLDWFPSAQIIGVDILPKPFDHSRYQHIMGDFNDPGLLHFIKQNKYEIIIDDASHLPPDQRKTCEELLGYVNKGGLLIIEDFYDVETAYQLAKDFGGVVLDRRVLRPEIPQDIILILQNRNY